MPSDITPPASASDQIYPAEHGPAWLKALALHGATTGHMPHRWVASFCGVTIAEYALDDAIGVTVTAPATSDRIRTSGPNITSAIKAAKVEADAHWLPYARRVLDRIVGILSDLKTSSERACEISPVHLPPTSQDSSPMTMTTKLPRKRETFTPGQPYPDYWVKIDELSGGFTEYRVSPVGEGIDLLRVAEQNVKTPPPFYIDVAASEDCLNGPDLVVYMRDYQRITDAGAVIADWLRRYIGSCVVTLFDADTMGEITLPDVRPSLLPTPTSSINTFPFTPAAALVAALNQSSLFEMIAWEQSCPFGSRIKGFVNTIEVVRLTKAWANLHTWVIDIPPFPVFVGRASDISASGFVTAVHQALFEARTVAKRQVEYLNDLSLTV